MSTRSTNICQLVPQVATSDVNSYHKLPQVMSTRTQQGEYQMMVRVDFSYYTTYVNSYHHQMATRTKHTILEDKECTLYITCNY